MSYKMDIPRDRGSVESVGSKAPYMKPTIVVYGSLTEITKTASGSSEDGGTDPFGFPQFSGLEG